MRLKYNNKPTVINGIRFASKREANRYIYLKRRIVTEEITGLKLQPRFDFPMKFFYKADFSYMEDGKQVVEDVKGFETAIFKLKKKCFKYFYPKLELRIVK